MEISSESTRLIEELDSLSLQGVLLIDGHHVFLEAEKILRAFHEKKYTQNLPQIQLPVDINDVSIDGDPNVRDEMLTEGKIWEVAFSVDDQEFEVTDKTMAEFILRVMLSLQRELLRNCAERIYPRDQFYVKADLEEIAYNQGLEGLQKKLAMKKTMVEGNILFKWFDAKLDDPKHYKRRLQEFIKWNERNIRLVDSCKEKISEIEKGVLRLQDGHKVPWNLKGNMLQLLHEYGSVDETKLMVMKILRQGGTDAFFQEKGVDVALTIEGTDLSHDEATDVVAIMTNDQDYCPLIEVLKERKKEVFLVSWVPERFTAKKLKEVVGPNNVIYLWKMLSAYVGDPGNRCTTVAEIYANFVWHNLVVTKIHYSILESQGIDVPGKRFFF